MEDAKQPRLEARVSDAIDYWEKHRHAMMGALRHQAKEAVTLHPAGPHRDTHYDRLKRAE